ncbi:MAG TPA: GNAT family N-acetyltransferase [Nitrospira sp.]|nr:GNAT family N-acetyltransferase [Nitrosomonas sp. PRO5]HQV10606.1 GNAT family N-acetyltransferase [Nitrospira sp.]
MRKMLLGDIGCCVNIHLACFPESLLSFLGPAFLRTYYEGLVASGLGISLVYEEGEQLMGFVAGFSNPRRYYEFLLRTRTLRFCTASVAAIFKRPAIIPRLVGALTYPSKTPSGSDRILLSSIAVLPAFRRRGVGTKLVQAFLAEAMLRGGKGVYLGVKMGDQQAKSFYENLGFEGSQDIPNPGYGDSVLLARNF